jgi:hypothetical protein
MRSFYPVGFVVWAAACGPTPPERPVLPEVIVVAEPEAPLEAVAEVVRLRVSGLAASPAQVLLFEGALSRYHEGRIRSAELPTTLFERLLPVTAFASEVDGAVVVAPTRPLRPGGSYTLSAVGVGNLASIVVGTSSALSYAKRIFPPSRSAGGTRWVYCGASLDARREIVLEPGAVRAVVTPGVAAGDAPEAPCFRLDVVGTPGGILLPPPRVGSIAIDPAPVSLAPVSPVAPPSCTGDEAPFGPGCATVYDDRVTVRSPAAPLVWALRIGESTAVVATAPEGRFVVAGLTPASRVRAWGIVADAVGSETIIERTLVTRAPSPHLVVNEVLANPGGPEPAQEWVELLNDGSRSESLSGFTLGDADGESVLPPLVLEPGAFALVVPDAFDVGGHLDVPVREGTFIVRVPRLGQGGLSNSGERVTLRAPGGVVASSFPPLASSGSGVSVARRSPGTLDDDADGFGQSGGAGASPGSPNETE